MYCFSHEILLHSKFSQIGLNCFIVTICIPKCMYKDHDTDSFELSVNVLQNWLWFGIAANVPLANKVPFVVGVMLWSSSIDAVVQKGMFLRGKVETVLRSSALRTCRCTPKRAPCAVLRPSGCREPVRLFTSAGSKRQSSLASASGLKVRIFTRKTSLYNNTEASQLSQASIIPKIAYMAIRRLKHLESLSLTWLIKIDCLTAISNSVFSICQDELFM